MNHPPEFWYAWYQRKVMTRLELFSQLMNCVMEYPVARVVGVLDPELREGLRDFVEQMSSIRNDHEIVSMDGRPGYGVAEVQKVLAYFREHPGA
jgi:hypothetical protein